MIRLLAPIFTFTAEEVWGALPTWRGKDESVHLTQFPRLEEEYFHAELGERWKSMIDVRAEIAKAIEQARKEKVIGHSLDARICIAAPDKMRSLIAEHIEDMRALLIVSQLQLVDEKEITNPYKSEELKGLVIGVEKARGAKCERCWIYAESVGSDARHPTVCGRCLPNI